MGDALDRMLSDGVRAALGSATRLVLDADRREQQLRYLIAAEIEQFADDHSDVSDAYRHAAMIAKGIPGA